jgi:predicted negative regulator of RcsB-dependent stress response
MNRGKKLAGTALALMLAVSPMVGAEAAWGQMTNRNTGSVVSTQESTDGMDQQLAYDISHAWAENEDASGAVAFQENGEIALSQGDKQRARRNFEAAEKELAHLKPSPVAPFSSVSR